MRGRIRIEAPDALTAFGLKCRLSRVADSEIVEDGEGWALLVRHLSSDEAEALEDVLEAVRRWLAEEGMQGARVDCDGARHVVELEARA